MLIYYFIWGILSLSSLIEVVIFQQRNLLYNKIREFIIWMIWSLFIGIVCFKGAVGTDYFSYQQMFEYPSLINEDFIEPLFLLWLKIFSFLTISFPLFWLITGLLNISLKIYEFKWLSPFVSVSMLIYLVGLFFERDFDGIRQGISIGICYFACILYLKGARWYKYVGVVVCAILFHYTSFLFLLIPLLARIRLKAKWIYLMLTIGLLCVFLEFDVLKLFFTIAGYDNFVYDKLYSYLNSDDYSRSVGLNIGLFFRIIIMVLFYNLRTRICISDRQYNLLFNGFFLAIFISLVFNNIEILSHRLAYGFREFQIFIIPYLILAFKGYKNKLLVTAIICLYSFVLLYRLLNTPHLMDYYYYKTIFEL